MFGLLRTGVFTLALLALPGTSARAESVCDPDGVQASGSIYRICMPPSGYNGMLIVWAHGFQDAGTPVSIPEDQLCINDFCLPALANGLGFAFATNSYSKTGLAVLQGQADILDLVNLFSARHGLPRKVYLVGASAGGLIAALNVEQHPDVFAAGVAACGPVGGFSAQIAYVGDARTTFEYFFPGVIPGGLFAPRAGLAGVWDDYYEQVVRPIVLAPHNRRFLDQWVEVARLPYDAESYEITVEQSIAAVLRYSVVNFEDTVTTLGGIPFDNRHRWYAGSENDLLLNLFVQRVAADPSAVGQLNTFYNTTGILSRPVITLHTLRDQQVPYLHEQLYASKTFFSGSLFTRHLDVTIDRYGHCNFTRDEALFVFAMMLLYDGVLDHVSGTASFFTPSELAAFERRARASGLPYRRAGPAVAFALRQR
jgi:pimeloyl-ACP methyl ester carboxylesterase